VSELPDFPYSAERGFFRRSRHPELPDELLLENASVRAERLPDPPDRPAPLVGEHTREIAGRLLGLPEAEIEALTEANVLQSAVERSETRA
jgi:crotonobetainyl-CoA:carnitine CoA-transferase CaiB-like acyl-CoA transferase